MSLADIRHTGVSQVKLEAEAGASFLARPTVIPGFRSPPVHLPDSFLTTTRSRVLPQREQDEPLCASKQKSRNAVISPSSISATAITDYMTRFLMYICRCKYGKRGDAHRASGADHLCRYCASSCASKGCVPLQHHVTELTVKRYLRDGRGHFWTFNVIFNKVLHENRERK